MPRYTGDHVAIIVRSEHLAVGDDITSHRKHNGIGSRIGGINVQGRVFKAIPAFWRIFYIEPYHLSHIQGQVNAAGIRFGIVDTVAIVINAGKTPCRHQQQGANK